MAINDESEKGITLDPNFFSPPNVLDLKYGSTTSGTEDGENPEGNELSDSVEPSPLDAGPESYPTDDLTPEATFILPVPENITVVSQTVRTKAGGGYAVDVVVDLADIPGIENFDLGVTKA